MRGPYSHSSVYQKALGISFLNTQLSGHTFGMVCHGEMELPESCLVSVPQSTLRSTSQRITAAR